MWSSVHRFFRNDRAAVAPTVALALFALIAVGGISFDYARLAAMDTELQQAADQAALAAATQLDRGDGAQERATAAIQNPIDNRLSANITRFANDGSASGNSVEITNITFCKEFDDDNPDTTAACTVADDDTDSVFVIVTTELRTANFAFTPIVAAFSGTLSSTAVAGVQSSICNIAPLFVCVNDSNFPEASDVGKGLLMKTGAQNSWFPGNYGFLDFGAGNPGVIDALLGHGLNGCQPIDESNTEPGNKNATDAINTRFDIYAGSGSTNSPSICTDLADGTGCPDQNTGKDLTMQMTYVKTQKIVDPAPTAPVCGTAATPKTGNPNPSLAYSDFALNDAAKGMPRDTCHYSGTCAGGNFGDANWDRTTYMAANHPGVSVATVATAMGKTSTTLTRYDVYQWEIANQNTSGTLDPLQVGATVLTTKDTGANRTYTFKKQCNFRKPRAAQGAAAQERRILPVVAAKCEGLNGASNLDEFQAIRVFNVFLTEPSMQRTLPGVTDDKEIYGEVLGPAEVFGGTGGFQYYARNRPYLVR